MAICSVIEPKGQFMIWRQKELKKKMYCDHCKTKQTVRIEQTFNGISPGDYHCTPYSEGGQPMFSYVTFPSTVKAPSNASIAAAGGRSGLRNTAFRRILYHGSTVWCQ